MARHLSRTSRLCLVFAAIAVGVVGIVDPKILAGAGALAGGVATILNAIVRRRKRAAFELRDRIGHRADNTARAAEKTDTTTAKVKCLHCEHVQTVPVSQETVSCEQCGASLKRRTAPARSD